MLCETVEAAYDVYLRVLRKNIVIRNDRKLIDAKLRSINLKSSNCDALQLEGRPTCQKRDKKGTAAE